jgi:CheY-like chemotaxis protein
VPPNAIQSYQQCGRINDLLSSAPSRIGLGLTHAKSYLAKTNGKLTISSIETKGTIITIDLPKATIPTWLCTELVLNQNARIAVIDDDQTIHDTWNRKLSDATYPLFHFQSSELFLAWYQNNPAIPLIILCDYEFINSTQNGLDVFEKINTQQKILVTSHYDEKSIIERCMQLNIKLLPKHFVPFIKIKKIDSTPPSLIFIDNEPYNINIWRHFAELKDIKIKTYLSSEDFWKDKDQFSHDIPIYIDCDLGQNKPKGVEVAKTLQAEGFKNLYLATGYTGGEIDSLPSWLTLVSKEPPFM